MHLIFEPSVIRKLVREVVEEVISTTDWPPE
jgi:hypothetical protein